MARDEEGFMQRWRDGNGRIKGMANRAPDEWVISSELNMNHKKVPHSLADSIEVVLGGRTRLCF